ncbi:MAG TPA: hypothetical protein VFP37_01005, partial [Steroidobacteraceae bacterium]|nr:hypothetical protein [Steroidobacteraceae bacterium]
MAHTFDIRFARSAGIAALFEAAGNRFGWKGGGRLSIDAEGMSFALKRGALAPLARRRSQRIPAQTIREIYREGAALRVEFASDEDPRAVLPFWASNRETAAQIVQLAPTSRTFEVESEPAGSPAKRKTRLRFAPLGVGTMLLIAALTLLFMKRPAVDEDVASATPPPPMTVPVAVSEPEAVPAPQAGEAEVPEVRIDAAGGEPITADEARKLAILAEDPVDWTQPPATAVGFAAEPESRGAIAPQPQPAAPLDDAGFVPMEVPDYDVSGGDTVTPIPPGTLTRRAASELLAQFSADAATLSRNFQTTRGRFDAGELQAPAFAEQLDVLADAWVALNRRLLQDRKYADAALDGLRATLI